MISLAHAGILILVALLYAANVEAQENQLLETLTRPRKVCEEGGLQFQPDKNNCGRFYECGLVGLARHYGCPGDQLFNVEQQYCDYPERVDCGDRPSCDESGKNCVNGHVGKALGGSSQSETNTAGPKEPTEPVDPILTKLGVGGTIHVGEGRWVQKRFKPKFWGHHPGDLCPLSIVNCYNYISYCPHCTANRFNDPKPYQEGYCSPYYCQCRQERFQFAQRWRCPPGMRFDEAYLKCREKEEVLECQAEPDQDDEYPYELVPFEPTQM